MKKSILIAVSYMLAALAHADTRIAAWGTQAPIPDEATKTATQISAGDLHTVVVLADGTTRGWGNASITDNRFAPFTAADLTSFGATAVIKADAGGAHTAYWLNNGMVIVRGQNSDGRLGDFPFPGDLAITLFPVIIDVTTGRNFTAVAYRNGGTYYIRVWGRVLASQLNKLVGPGDISINHRTWNSTFPILDIEGGPTHLAWSMDNGVSGVVTGFGGTTIETIPPIGHSYNSGAWRITCGGDSTYWIRINGNVYATGYLHTDPIETGVDTISAGIGHLLLNTDGVVTAMTPFLPIGNNVGQANVPVLPPSPLVGQTEAGYTHSVALTIRTDPPVMTISSGVPPNDIILTWPSGFPEYNVLQLAPTLSTPTVWTDGLNIPPGFTAVGIAVPMEVLNYFFKLRAPAFFYLE